MNPEKIEFPNLPERLSGLGELANKSWMKSCGEPITG